MSTSDTATIAFPQWAIVPITVTGQDITLDVRLEQGKTFRASDVCGTTPPADFKSVTIGLTGPNLSGVSLSTPAKSSPLPARSFAASCHPHIASPRVR